MRFMRVTYSNPPIGQLTEPRDVNWQFGEILKFSSLIFMMDRTTSKNSALLGLIRFIATIVRVRVSDIRVNNFRATQPRVRAESQARLMFINCSQNGQLGLYQNQCTFQKIHSLSKGGAHSRA